MKAPVRKLYAVIVPDDNAALILEFQRRLSNGLLRFKKVGTDHEFHFHQAEWDDMCSDRRACRISTTERGDGGGSLS